MQPLKPHVSVFFTITNCGKLSEELSHRTCEVLTWKSDFLICSSPSITFFVFWGLFVFWAFFVWRTFFSDLLWLKLTHFQVQLRTPACHFSFVRFAGACRLNYMFLCSHHLFEPFGCLGITPVMYSTMQVAINPAYCRKTGFKHKVKETPVYI